MNNGLVQSLNAIREMSSDIYHKYIPIIDDSTDIGKFAEPILTIPEVYNEFCNSLVNRLVFTQYKLKSFRNPLQMLEGDKMPLGYSGREVHINRAKGRQYNANDFAGLLVKYEADVKVSYHTINADLQYPLTFSREQLKKAMISWGELENFIDGLTNSLYNGAYIDSFNLTKEIISSCYKENKGVIETITAISDESTAKAFIERARELYLNFQLPSGDYNAWNKVSGNEDKPVITWTNPEDIVLVIKNSLRAKLDVNVLADAFNIDRTTLLGQIVCVDNFDVYDDEGNKVFDGSNIVGLIADKSWFKIKEQDMFMDTFYNPNNRSTQFYLNVIKMYNYSLFANGIIFATAAPTKAYDDLIVPATLSVVAGETVELKVKGKPAYANAEITYTSGTTAKATVAKSQTNERVATITGVAEGTSVITVTTGSGEGAVTKTCTVTVTAAEA